jgi:hypothetical protein
MKEKVAITKLSITQTGQIILFEVKIPRDAIRIKGVCTTVTMITPVVVPPVIPPVTPPIPPVPPAIPPVPPVTPPVIPPVSPLIPVISNPNLPVTSPQWIGFLVSTFLGDLRLQSYGKANIFIAENVYLQDANIGQGDFTIISQFIPTDWSHQVKHKRTEAWEDSSVNVLKGIYRDRQNGVIAGDGLAYTVGVYLWYEINPETL